jgi:hypothetical protein
VPDAAGLPSAPTAAGAWPPVVGLFCATANEAPLTSSALTITRLFRVPIDSSNAKPPLPRVAAKKPLADRRAHLLIGSQNRVFSAPNNRVHSHITAAKPRLTALCNSRAPPAALGRQESVRRVVVCKSVARTLAVSWAPVPTRLDLRNRRAEPFCWDTPSGLMRHSLKSPSWLLRERELSSLHPPSCCADACPEA